jgi:hypothetical protein
MSLSKYDYWSRVRETDLRRLLLFLLDRLIWIGLYSLGAPSVPENGVLMQLKSFRVGHQRKLTSWPLRLPVLPTRSSDNEDRSHNKSTFSWPIRHSESGPLYCRRNAKAQVSASVKPSDLAASLVLWMRWAGHVARMGDSRKTYRKLRLGAQLEDLAVLVWPSKKRVLWLWNYG